ncbi:MAG TPA: hypothetical protein VHY20_05755, partial [Pirellulales bacterium]|nr:hypothetical protein [Pirellulales bacterium]
VAGLVFAVSRPLASGWLGLTAGGRPDTTLVLLDRSPSMQQRDAAAGDSKLATGRRQIVRTLETLGSGHWALIESARHEPIELESPATLLNLPQAGPVSASANLPAMLQAAHEYIRDNRPGRTEVWICSDLREQDWNPQSGRWPALREALLELPQGVRINLLAYPQAAAGNLSIRATEVRRQETSDGAELLVSLQLQREGADETRPTVPVQFEIEGARSVLSVELSRPRTDFKDHRIPLERSRHRGWGRVSIPADANPADNDFYFVFDDPPPRRTIVVAEDPQAQRPLLLAAEVSPDPALHESAEAVALDALPTVAWDQVALVLWQAPLPSGAPADLLGDFVDRGGQIAFFPPREPDSRELFGVRWQSWKSEKTDFPVATWRSDEDLLARTLSGQALPLGQLEVHRYCGLSGDFTPLATLADGAPLLTRVPTRQGGVYFWTTTPALRDSSLATGGVVLYAAVQRAISAGAQVLGLARIIDAAQPADTELGAWRRVAGQEEGLSTEFSFQRGVYRVGDRLLAVNRPAAEDDPQVLTRAGVAELFRGLNFVRVDYQAGNLGSLIQEIWRTFLWAMLAALVVEAALSLPKPAREARAAA